MHAADFDGIKLDDCGQFQNLTKWERLINATGRAVLIENWCEVVTNVVYVGDGLITTRKAMP